MKKIIFCLAIISIFISCNKIRYPESGSLEFSSDTIFFDTIFTQIGSTTKEFKVYNKTNTPIRIDKLYLSNQNTKYRLNIDGFSQNSIENITIDANDSMYIFVEVTIDPKRENYIIDSDSLIFESGASRQQVQLLSVGRDVHLINGKIIGTQTWTADKPYLIYNSMLVDSLATLTINPGVEVYSHRNSGIYVRGKLIANGTVDKPILFRGDRIDDDYYIDKPGQWRGIQFLRGSYENFMNYVLVSEGFYGILVDSSMDMTLPTLVINNSQIGNCSNIGVCGINTNINVINSVITDCGIHNVGLFYSGKYNFYNCTIQNDYKYSIRNTPSVGCVNYQVDANQNIHFKGNISSYFVNCIIYGNQKSEFIAQAYDTINSMSLLLENCLLKLDSENNNLESSIYKNCIINKAPKYYEKEENDETNKQKKDYHLSSNSPARKKGNKEIVENNISILGIDISGTNRLSDGYVDIGAYEFVQ